MRSVVWGLLLLGCSADVGDLFGGGGQGPVGGGGTGEGGEPSGGAPQGGEVSSMGGAGGQSPEGGAGGARETCDVDANDPGDLWHDIPCANCLETNCCELMAMCFGGDTQCNANWITVQECIEQNEPNCWLTSLYPDAPYWNQVVSCKQQFCDTAQHNCH